MTNLTEKDITVYSSVLINGTYKRGYFNATQVMDSKNPDFGKLLIINDLELLDFNVDYNKLLLFIFNNLEYFSTKKYVLSLSKFYLEYFRTMEYQLFSLY